jgi:hypothetical protein
LCHLLRSLAGAHRGLYVALDDAAAGAAPRQRAQIDAGVRGHARRERRDDEATLPVAVTFGGLRAVAGRGGLL